MRNFSGFCKRVGWIFAGILVVIFLAPFGVFFPALGAYNPAQLVGVATVTTLRAGNYIPYPYIYLVGYSSFGDGGQGIVAYNSGGSTDNSCTKFHDASGHEFDRGNLTNLPVSYCGVVPSSGSIPSGWADQTTGIENALNAANCQIPIVFAIGPYQYNADLMKAMSASCAYIHGAVPVYASGDVAPFSPDSSHYVIDPNSGSSYNQTPPTWVLSSGTVLYPVGTSSGFGEEDTINTYGFTYKLMELSNVWLWNGGGSSIKFGVHLGCETTHIHDSNIVLFASWNMLFRGGGDNCTTERVGLYDGGWNMPEQGSLTANSNYCSGANVLVGATGNSGSGTYQQYCGIAATNPNYWTQFSMRDIYSFDRNDTLSNKSGYRALQADESFGDVRLERFQSDSSVLAYNSVVVFDQPHIESFSSNGTSHNSSSDLYAIYVWDGVTNANSNPGWLGLGVQLHNGPNASSERNWVFTSGYGAYSKTSNTPPFTVNLAPKAPGNFGTVFRNRLGNPICQNTVAGMGGTDTFTFNSVLPDGYGADALIGVSIQSSTNNAAYNSQWFHMIMANNSGSYGTVADSFTDVLNRWIGFGVTFSVTTTGNGTTTSQGQNIQVSVTYTGASWVSGTPVCVNAYGFSGIINSN